MRKIGGRTEGLTEVPQMRVRRRDVRVWYAGLAVFFMVFLFVFLRGVSRRDSAEVGAASLAGFDPGYIMSDWQMGNYTSMSEAEIQRFLDSKVNCNKDKAYYDYLVATYPGFAWHFDGNHIVCLNEERFGDGEVIGQGDTAAHIIWQAAQDYRINPQVLIVLLQKEQSLITDSYPNTRQYRGATGYGCPDTAPCSAEYYGFKNQVRKAAALFRTVLDGGWTNYPLGNNYVQYNPNAACGGTVVNIRSLATSALYRYTPYQPNASALAAGYGTGDGCGAYGNRNFYLYFEDWFGGIKDEASNVEIPDGMYYIKSSLNNSYGLSYNGQKTINSSNYGKWYIEKKDKSYTIMDLTTNLYLTAGNSSLSLKNAADSVAQEWIIYKTTDGKYTFYSRYNNLVIDVSGASAANNTDVILYQQWGDNNLAQKWMIEEVSVEPAQIETGTYEIISDLVANYGLTLNSAAGIMNSGTKNRWYLEKQRAGHYTIREVESGLYLSHRDNKIYLNSTYEGENQIWLIGITIDGMYTIYIPNTKMVLDVSGALPYDNTPVGLYQRWGSNNRAQKWKLNKITINGAKIEAGVYNVFSMQNSSYGLAGSNNSIINSNSYGRWNIEEQNGLYTIKDESNGLYLTADGTKLKLAAGNGSITQKWIFQKKADDVYIIYSAYSYIVVDISGALPYNNTPVNLYPQWGDNNLAQKWKLKNTKLINATVEQGLYELTSMLSTDYALAPSGNSMINSSTHGKWDVKQGTDGYYTLQEVTSGKYLTANNSTLEIGNYSGNDCQKWIINSVGSGIYTIYSKCNYLVVDISGALPYNNTPVNLYPQWGDNNLAQKWKLKKVNIENVVLTEGTYEIMSIQNTNYGLAANGSNIINSNLRSKWQLEKKDNSYLIKEVTSGKYLTANNSTLEIGNYSGNDCQKWIINSVGSGIYTIYSKCNYLVVDISGALPYNNTPVNLYPQWGDNNLAQKWKLWRA